jgi:hypothetical protein
VSLQWCDVYQLFGELLFLVWIGSGKRFALFLSGGFWYKNGDSTAKGFCVQETAMTNFVKTMQQLLHIRFEIDPPACKTI